MDYYELLGVSQTANNQEIKISYRKLAMKWHPDRNQNSKVAEEKFKEIKEAYETLSNSSARFWYDRELNDLRKSRGYNQNSSYTSQTDDNYSNHTDYSSSDAQSESTFKDSTDNTYSQYTDNNDSNNDFYEEETTVNEDEFAFWRKDYPFANFHKYKLLIEHSESIVGKIVKFKYHIEGKGHINLTLTIPPLVNVDEILIIHLTNEDILLVSIEVLRNPHSNLDIHSKIDIDIFSALNGISVQLNTTTGVRNIVIPPLTKHGEIISLFGYGLKHNLFVGNLYVKINVFYPDFLSGEQQNLLFELATLQKNRDTHFLLKIWYFFKEIYYLFFRPHK